VKHFWPDSLYGLILISQDYRTGEMGASFIHQPLLIFYEVGHVMFQMLGEWMMVRGASLGQLIMPAVLAGIACQKSRSLWVWCP